MIRSLRACSPESSKRNAARRREPRKIRSGFALADEIRRRWAPRARRRLLLGLGLGGRLLCRRLLLGRFLAGLHRFRGGLGRLLPLGLGDRLGDGGRLLAGGRGLVGRGQDQGDADDAQKGDDQLDAAMDLGCARGFHEGAALSRGRPVAVRCEM